MVDFIIILVIGICGGLAVFYNISNKKKGKSSCGCNCNECNLTGCNKLEYRKIDIK